jgi:hypothetical protein
MSSLLFAPPVGKEYEIITRDLKGGELYRESPILCQIFLAYHDQERFKSTRI